MSNWPNAPPVSDEEVAEHAWNVAAADYDAEADDASNELGFRDGGARVAAIYHAASDRGDFDTREDEAEIKDGEDLIPDGRHHT